MHLDDLIGLVVLVLLFMLFLTRKRWERLYKNVQKRWILRTVERSQNFRRQLIGWAQSEYQLLGLDFDATSGWRVALDMYHDGIPLPEFILVIRRRLERITPLSKDPKDNSLGTPDERDQNVYSRDWQIDRLTDELLVRLLNKHLRGGPKMLPVS